MSKKRKNIRASQAKNSALSFETLEPRQLLAADIAIEWMPMDSQPLVGETVDVSLLYSNNGDSAGYGPFVNVVVPGGSADGDGLHYVSGSGSMLDSSLSESVMEFDANGVAEHPFAKDANGDPILVNGNAGDQLVVFELPFGSFTPDQPAMQIDLQLEVDGDALAGDLLQLEATGGLRYGNDALDNPSSDPVVESAAATFDVVPEFVRTEITHLGPEGETATGENFIQSYEVTFDLVEGVDVTDLDIIAQFDSNVVFMGFRNESFGSETMAVSEQPTIGEAANGSQLKFSAANWTGGAGTDGSFIFDVYVPQHDANDALVIDADSPVDSGSTFQTYATGNWTKTQATESTPADIVSFASVPATHELQGEYLAVQQRVSISNDVNASSYSPGDELEYEIEFQISDYATLDDLKIEFTIPNGQQFESAQPQTLTLRGVSQVNGTTQDFDIQIQQGASWSLANQVYEVDVAGILADEGLSSRLHGGETSGGLSTAVTGTITYYATIQDEFGASVASGDLSVDEGDIFQSTANATATNVGPTVTGFVTGDNSSETRVLAVSSIQTSVYAINGVQGASLEVSAGDKVTYKITRQVRNSDVEDLVISNYLPLPVFGVDQIQWVGDGGSLTENTIEIGSADTFHSAFGITPTLDLDPSNNSFSLTYGDVDSASNQTTTIELLVTVEVKDQPFADGLWLSSLANSAQDSSNHTSYSSNDLTSIQYTRPVLTVEKSATGSDNVNSSVVDGVDLGTDIENVDAGDTVQFEVRIENTGQGQHGAYDVHVVDQIPAGFSIPSTGLNLAVVDGDGSSLTYTLSNGGTGLFDQGIELTDPIAWSGDEVNSNVVLVRYDLVVSDVIEAGTSTSSTASAVHYAALENGENYVTSEVQDDAIASFANASVSHVVTATSQDHTQDNNVVIGEIVTYKATVYVPEGTMSNASLVLKTPRGAAINEIIGVSYSNAITVAGQTAESILASAVVSDHGSDIRNGGRILTVDVGDIVNSDSDNLTGEYFEVTYTATITNDAGNDYGDNRRNSATWTHDSGQLAKNSNDVKINEPRLELSRTWNNANVDANDEVTVSLSITPTQNLGATAFDISFEEFLPDGVTYVPGSFQWVSGVAPTSLTDANGEPTAQLNSIALNEASQFEYRVTVDADVHSGDSFTYDANLSWSSLAGDSGQITPNNDLAFERTGDVNDVGGSANDHVTNFASNLTIAPVELTLELVGSSESHTLGNELTIGETAEYDITLTVPEGVHSISLEGLDESLNSTLQLDSLEITQIGNNLVLENGDVGTTVTVDGNGKLVIDFGIVTNTADNLETVADQIVLRLVTTVTDISDNADGDTSIITANVDYSFGTDSESETQNIVEPKLVVNQTVSSNAVDANEAIDVTITVEHHNTSGADAITFNLSESLAGAGLAIDASSLVVNGAQIEQNSDGNIVVSNDLLDESGVITLTYNATVDSNATPGTSIELTPSISYRSAEHAGGRSYTGSDSDFVTLNSVQISGSVLIDENQDGTEQFGDLGIGGVTITLVGTDHLDQAVSLQTQTLQTGQFNFDGLRPGTYSLIQTQPEGITDGADFVGSLGGLVGQNRFDSIVAPEGQSTNATSYVFTETPRTWITGTVFFDENQNAELGIDELGLEGIEITLTGVTDEGESVSRTVFTNERGYYIFGQLEAGTYDLVEGSTPGYYDAAEQLGTNGGQLTNDAFTGIVIAPLSAGEMYNFGEYAPANISGTVYIDLDRDGVRDRYDGLIAAVTVSLNGTNDLGETITSSMTTDIDGRYQFDNLRPGTYHIASDPVIDLESSVSNIGNFLGNAEAVAGNGVSIVNGFNSIALPAGAEAQSYNIGHTDPLFSETILETDFEIQTAFAGTNGDDTFNVSVTGNDATVMFNGVQYDFDNSSTRSLRMLGSFGDDALVFTGSENKEVFQLRKHSARITGTWFETLVYGMEDMTIMGGGNEDVARFYDTIGDDTFTAQPFAATMTGEGYENSVHDIHRIYGYMSQGFDTASFIGEAGVRDNFRSTPTWSNMFNDDFYVFANNADTTLAVATDDSDRAYLYDSENDDTLNGNESVVTFSGDTFAMTTSGYDYVSVFADKGGTDTASLVGTTGDDHFVSRPTIAIFDTADTRIIGRGFEVVSVAANGGDDIARVHDSHHDDVFTANSNVAFIQNAINETTMSGFDRAYAYMRAGGSDSATLNGSGAEDVFRATPDLWNITGGGSYVYGIGFTSVVANGTGNDKAYLYDSEFNDTLNLVGNIAVMQGELYSNTASGFAKVTSRATTGIDRVVYQDSDARSTVRVHESLSTIFGPGFNFNAIDFDTIDSYYTDLEGDDNVDLNAKVFFDLEEVDLEFASFKLSVTQDDAAETKVFNNRVHRLT